MEREGARPGTVYLVGAGPGDPALITVRGQALLQTADVVLHDALVETALLRLVGEGAQLVSVGKRGDSGDGQHTPQAEIEARMISEARAGRRVVRLKGGDPYLFGRGSEEAETLHQAGIPFEVIPGVTSPLAAAAYAGIALTHRELASSVTIVSAVTRGKAPFDFAELEKVRGTVVVLMGRRHLERVARELIERGGRHAETPSALVEAASTPRQRTVVGRLDRIAELAEAERIGTPSLLIVGEVVTLREAIRWFDRLPLLGKKILVGRAADQADDLARVVRQRGGLPVEVPLLSIQPILGLDQIERMVAALPEQDVLAFTSANGVKYFFEALGRVGRDARVLARTRIAVIGGATGEALASRGLIADVTPSVARGEALAEAILADLASSFGSARGRRVLLAQAEVAREALATGLLQGGAEVEAVAVYRTAAGEPGTAAGEKRAELVGSFERGEIDAVLLTSPSTLNHLIDLLGAEATRLLGSVTLAAIGEVTADAVRARGLMAGAVAGESSANGLVLALEEHFSRRSLAPP